jgi:capsular exopolysaccharide synthesis family protein
LSADRNSNSLALQPRSDQVYTVHAGPGAESDEEQGTPFAHYLWIINRYRWPLMAFVGASMVAALVISSRMTPIYKSIVTVDIDRQLPLVAIGDQGAQSDFRDADQFIATQEALIKSDSVLRPVVKRYKLNAVQSRGAFWSFLFPRTDRPDAPVELRELKVRRPTDTYLLEISYRSENPQLAADVANAIADSYLEHTYEIRIKASTGLANAMQRQLEELRAKMERSSGALAAFERQLNLIDPQQKTSILSNRLIQLNQEYTTAQADRMTKESAYNSMKTDLMEAVFVSSQADVLRRLMDQLNEAQQRFATASAQYGPNHPEYKKAQIHLNEATKLLADAKKQIFERVRIEYEEAVNREKMLEKAVGDTKAEYDALNSHTFEYQNLKEEAQADKTLYDELTRKIQEAGINSSFQSSSIRIDDPARPAATPDSPKPLLNVALAFILSSVFGIGVVIVREMFDDSVRDPQQIGRLLETEVVGSLPTLARPGKEILGGGSRKAIAGAVTMRDPQFSEAVRTLRNAVLLSDFDSSLHAIMVTSAAPMDGKTTTAAGLAIAHAEQQYKTLLIDCDLRRPAVHARLGIEGNRPGLSKVLTEDVPWRSVVVNHPDHPNLWVLPAGYSSSGAVSLLTARFPAILEEIRREYDMIIVDSPPILGFAEPLSLSTMVDGILMVARIGQTNRKALVIATTTLRRLRSRVIGLVLNDLQASDHRYYYYNYGYYQSRYYRQEPEAAE